MVLDDVQNLANAAQLNGFLRCALAQATVVEIPGIFRVMWVNGIAFTDRVMEDAGVDLTLLPYTEREDV